MVRHLEDEGRLRHGDEVLDVGCGPGTYTLPMARRAPMLPAGAITALIDRYQGEPEEMRRPMLPAGAITALIGGPILIYLLLMRRDGIAV